MKKLNKKIVLLFSFLNFSILFCEDVLLEKSELERFELAEEGALTEEGKLTEKTELSKEGELTNEVTMSKEVELTKEITEEIVKQENENTEKLKIAEEATEALSKEKINTEEVKLSEDGKTTEEGEITKEVKLSKKVEIPFSDKEEVQKFRNQYLNPKWTKLLSQYLESALPYRLYVRKQLKEHNLPFYLEYLPIVESNYKTKAKSRSGALGMWQFMENSVYPFLKLNEYIDERLDPWKSTDAALKKLTDNYNFFGDWYIAIGAYNCGAGAMAKALKKSDEKDFWSLCSQKLIPKQTADYVPKLLAIADLVENCEFYDVDLPKHHKEYELLEIEKHATFDYITVEKAYSIKQLAQEMRIDYDELHRLNPSYIKGFTLPKGKSQIRLPLGMEQSAKDALKTMQPINFPFKHTVQKGESLWSISRHYNVSIKSLCEINDIKENDILRIGKILYIPSK